MLFPTGPALRLLSVRLAVLFTGVVVGSWAGTLVGQENPPVEPAHRSSQGKAFVAIPGTAVLFATTETTVAEFRAFAKSGESKWSYQAPFEQGEDHPVVGVTLQDAQAYCAWLTKTERADGKIAADQSYRLPTSAEWSAAAGQARARKRSAELTAEETLADQQRFPWGLKWPPPPNSANLSARDIAGYEDAFDFTAPVGTFAASPDGLHDLSGNVWEWVWDASIESRPRGLLRGGSWAYFNEDCLRSGYEYEVPSELQSPTVGFRVVFEDRARAADLLASAGKSTGPALSGAAAQLFGTGGKQTDSDELEAMRRRLAGEADPVSAGSGPDPASLKPATVGSRHLNTLGMTLLPLPGGKVLLAENELRAADYEAYLKATRQTWVDKPPHISSPQHPAAGLSWRSATDFCDWLTRTQREAGLIPEGARYRLPTDAEWSAAAGLDTEEGADPIAKNGRESSQFPWGTDWPPPARSANLDAPKIDDFDDTFAYTCPVDSHDPNARGFRELAGNVAEWCQDAWADKPGDRVYRGGSWLSSERAELLTSKRQHAPEDAERANIGLRCALELPIAPPTGTEN